MAPGGAEHRPFFDDLTVYLAYAILVATIGGSGFLARQVNMF